MIKSGYLGFLVFVSMMIIFFILPDPKGLQKPFRIMLGLSFVIIYFALLIKKEIGSKTLWPVVIGGFLVILMIYRGTFQTNLVNAYLCLFGLLSISNLYFELTPIRKTNLEYIVILGIFSMLLQLMLYSSPDGRPSLSYQINFAGAYLFLFFICSDVLKSRYGKIFVIAIALVTFIRLLIYSILLFYIIRFFKKYFASFLYKLNAASIAIAGYIILSLFSLWYVANVKARISRDNNISRVTTINDESNKMRFFANAVTMGIIYSAPFDDKVLFGMGSIENFTNATKGEVIMPHNEIFDAIVEYGIISVILFSILSFSFFNKVTSYSNLEYYIPIVFHTLILYVRFLIVPSFEMLFILFLLFIVRKKEKLKPALRFN
jgi:hypothetical protein